MGRRSLYQASFSAEEEPSINLTALIDVVFVILIMFILVAPLLELDRIELAEGPKGAKEDVVSLNDNSPIAIHVNDANEIRINRHVVHSEQLLWVLQKEYEKHPSTHPQVFHDRKASFGTYQQIKNAVEMAGFENMDIILQPG